MIEQELIQRQNNAHSLLIVPTLKDVTLFKFDRNEARRERQELQCRLWPCI